MNNNTMSTARFSMEEKKTLSFKRAFKRYRVLYGILAVIMAYYILFYYVPIVMGILMAFKNVKVGMAISAAPWVGFDNFKTVVTDSEMTRLVINTFRMSVFRLFWGFWPPIVLAILIFDLTSKKFKRVSQTIVYIPYFFSWVVVYGIVYSFFSGSGLINSITTLVGWGTKDFLTDPHLFLPLLIGSQIWKNVGWGTILYFAAMTGVNPELYEACRIDGAGPITRTRVVTLPAMMPVVMFSLIMSLGSILNNDFEQVLLFYNSAVYSVGDIIDTWVYRIGLGKMQYSVGAAVSIMKAIVSMVLVLGANYVARRVSGRGMW